MAKIQVFDLLTDSEANLSNMYSLTDQEINLIKGGVLALVALPFISGFVGYRIVTYK